MTDDTTDGLASSQPAAETTSLDSIISAALAQRAPGDDGRMPSTDTATAEVSAGAADAVTADDPSDAQPGAEPAGDTVQPLEPHPRWTAEQKALFSKLPREAQQFVLERNREIDADYTRKTQELAETRRQLEPLQQALKPYEQYFRQINVHPAQAVPALINAEMMLRSGTPQQKLQLVARLASDYGVNLAHLAGDSSVQPAPDPHTQHLHHQLSQLGAAVSSLVEHRDLEQQRQAQSAIDAFVTASDTAGAPRYPHFQRVRGVMAQAIADAVSRGESLTLDQAYAEAVAPLDAAIADEITRRDAAREKERADAVEKAKKAMPVRSSGSAPNGSARTRGLDAIIDGAMSRAGFP